jgi:hypothetical protein
MTINSHTTIDILLGARIGTVIARSYNCNMVSGLLLGAIAGSIISVAPYYTNNLLTTTCCASIDAFIGAKIATSLAEITTSNVALAAGVGATLGAIVGVVSSASDKFIQTTCYAVLDNPSFVFQARRDTMEGLRSRA